MPKIRKRKQIETKIYVSEEILKDEYSYTYGEKKDQKVDFIFINIRTGKENTKQAAFNYRHALNLARERCNDRRYKNYEYAIM